jgi:two-component system phosphate regulon sensor histidine kinase PhoR
MRTADLVEVVHRAMDTFRFRLEREGLEVVLIKKGEIPAMRLDEQAIVLAIMNLLDNAVKYGGSDGPVEIILERGRRHVYVRVHDHGPGIPSTEHRRVFERFYRVRRDTETRGSGIGLSLVERIALAHGGRAWAENAPEGGAIVSFSLPLRTASFIERAEREQQTQEVDDGAVEPSTSTPPPSL